MREWHFVFLVQCPLMLAFPVVNLLLPGFSDQTLEAGIIKEVRYYPKLMSDQLIFQGEWHDHIHCSYCGNGKVNATWKQHDSFCCSNLVWTDQYCEQGQVQWISAISQIVAKIIQGLLSCLAILGQRLPFLVTPAWELFRCKEHWNRKTLIGCL